MHPGTVQFRVQQPPELATPQTRLTLPLLPYQFHHQGLVHLGLLTHLTLAVIVLARHARRTTQGPYPHGPFYAGLDDPVDGSPTFFFLKTSISWPNCSQA